MAQTKAEIIEALYKAGKISFAEAMTLSSQEGKPIEPTMYDGAQQDQANLRAKSTSMRLRIVATMTRRTQNTNRTSRSTLIVA